MKTAAPDLKPSVLAWVYLMRIYCLVARCADKELKVTGLTLPQFDVITQLGALEGCCTQEALCDRLLVTKGNVSGLVSRMVQEGLVSRQEDPANRRCNRVQLTAKGRRLFEAVGPDHEACLDGMFSTLSAKEQEQLRDLLGKVLVNVRAKAGCSGEPERCENDLPASSGG
jgi:DNA-binding MarR family transcriptional regulator